MTLASETARQRHNGNGATTSFTTGFIFQDNTHVRVIYTDASGVDTEWTENTQYTLTGADTGSNGTVTVITSPVDYTPASSTHLTVIRDVPFTQTLDGTVLSTMSAEDQEDALDKIWMGLGQVKEALSRALLSAETGAGGEPTVVPLEIAVATDGSRRVLRIVETGEYVGSSGAVASISDGVDIRGPAGTSGAGSGDMLAANNLSDLANKPTAFANIKQAATTGATGVAELCTDGEAQAKSDTARVLTASNLAALSSTTTFSGLVELATNSEAVTGTDTARAVTPAGVAAALAAGSFVPSGTAMLFVQTSAPTGWTKSTTHNDKALRVVSGTASSGGSVNFSTLFARTTTDAATVIMPGYTGTVGSPGATPTIDGGGSGTGQQYNDSTGSSVASTANSNPSVTPAIDMRVKYVDTIIATKD